MADLPSGVGKELPDEVLPAMRRFHCVVRQALDFLRVVSRPGDQIEIADNDG
jgi:hypothetical protein